MGELKKVFRPEFINRVDDIIVFRKLLHDDIQKIAGKMLEGLKGQLRDMDIAVEFTQVAVEAVATPVLTRFTVQDRCAERSAARWKTRFPKRCSRAT